MSMSPDVARTTFSTSLHMILPNLPQHTILPQKSCQMPHFRSTRFNTSIDTNILLYLPAWQLVTGYLAPQNLGFPSKTINRPPGIIRAARCIYYNTSRPTHSSTPLSTSSIEPWLVSGKNAAEEERYVDRNTGPSVSCTISSLTATFVLPQVNSNQFSRSARHAIGRFVISRRG